jgi:peptidoglycan/LPS O-acetylase OafA/YrhL
VAMGRSLSLYLDVIRPLAALFVLLSHISQPHISGQLKALSNAGSQAVVVFFVLSGFVIAHVCATREATLRDYAIARAARIYSVALPALLLTLFLDILGQQVQPAAYPPAYQPFTPSLGIRSILFLGEQWGAHRYPGSNSAYWSLGFEVWYYVAFGAFLFSGYLAAIAVLLFIGPKVAIMFPCWLLGVAHQPHLLGRRLRDD